MSFTHTVPWSHLYWDICSLGNKHNTNIHLTHNSELIFFRCPFLSRNNVLGFHFLVARLECCSSVCARLKLYWIFHRLQSKDLVFRKFLYNREKQKWEEEICHGLSIRIYCTPGISGQVFFMAYVISKGTITAGFFPNMLLS